MTGPLTLVNCRSRFARAKDCFTFVKHLLCSVYHNIKYSCKLIVNKMKEIVKGEERFRLCKKKVLSQSYVFCFIDVNSHWKK